MRNSGSCCWSWILVVAITTTVILSISNVQTTVWGVEMIIRQPAEDSGVNNGNGLVINHGKGEGMFDNVFKDKKREGNVRAQFGRLPFEPRHHLIESLPGAPSLPFNMYSGYITVDADRGRALFYWLVESAGSPAEDPLTLWLNGGPGCSSVAGGMLSEIGPLSPDQLGESALRINRHSWNQASNLLFLESPAGVGFSYSNDTSDYVTGDTETAEDSFQFLLRFFALYPQFLRNDFYIMGQSYAGHYVPMLADVILKRGKVGKGMPGINLKGIGVGNPWTDTSIDNYGAAFYWWSHSLVSDMTFYGLVNTCNFSSVNSLLQQGNGAKCTKYTDKAILEMGPINTFDITVDACISSVARREMRKLAEELSYTGSGGVSTKPLLKSDIDPCINDQVVSYLNREDVQVALHANVTGLPYKYQSCSDLLQYSKLDLLRTMLPIYRNLLEGRIRILVFSGDLDAIIPVTGTRQWITKLFLPVAKEWRPWLMGQQVAGYIAEYGGLTFATVRQAGHMVGYTQPKRAFHLFESFVRQVPL